MKDKDGVGVLFCTEGDEETKQPNTMHHPGLLQSIKDILITTVGVFHVVKCYMILL